jgi:catechol 2,3-dioxygenase-like lactoylglutathione lyase family enzyme
MLTAIDHVILPAGDIDHAASRFEQLGLGLTPRARHLRQGTENRVFFVGNEDTAFYVELLGVHDRVLAHEAGRDPLLHAIDEGAGLWRVMLATDDLAAERKHLDAARVGYSVREVARDDGTKIGDVLEADTMAAGCRFSLIHYAEEAGPRRARHAANGLFDHGFPLKRLDHLAAIVRDLDAATAFWTDVLGVPVFGEVQMGPAALIRQMKVGDAVLELIGPTTEDSPLHQRPPGLASMCAFEVPDLAAAVETLRGRGFTSGDPAPGPLPGTRVASIPAPELGGMTLQLLEYV